MSYDEILELLSVSKRESKPRDIGLTMVLDKLQPIDPDFLREASRYIDIVKIGWTLPSTVSKEYLKRRIKRLKDLDILVSAGGTLIELAYSRGNVEKVLEILKDLEIDIVEISNGILNLSNFEKANLIQLAKAHDFIVISEVGKKNPSYRMSVMDAIQEAKSDLKAGAWKVIIEGREMGRASCVFDEKGDIIWSRVNTIVSEIGIQDVIFESPLYHQQVELILRLGPTVNLGNIRFEDVLALETLRLGIRGDTYLLGKDQTLEASPSARFVYYVLKEKGPLTIREIQRITGLSRRTIHNTIKELKEARMIKDYGFKGKEKIWGITI